MVPDRVRYFNKHVFNRLTSRNAGKEQNMFALIHHTGRRSGQAYETPIFVATMGEDFILALTYGPKVDWYRDLQNHERSHSWHNREYVIKEVGTMLREAALPAFAPWQRVILRLMQVRDFAYMKSDPPVQSK